MASVSDGHTVKDFKIEDLPNIWEVKAVQNWVVEGLIPENSVTIISGESGSGKSTVTLLLAEAVARGEAFIGNPTKQRKVLICDKENAASVYHSRFARFNLTENPNIFYWGYWCDPGPGGPDSKIVREFVQREQPLVIFDSFISFHPGDEQDATETRAYMDHFRELTGLGATVIAIHHTGKADSTKEYRGSSDIKASIDVGLVLTAKRPMLKLLQLRPFKIREGIFESLTLSVEGEKLVRVDSEYVDPHDMAWELVKAVVGNNPGINQSHAIELLPTIPPYKVRKLLIVGESTGIFKATKGLKNSSLYSLGEVKNAE
jgi:hypothetical protein